MTNNIKYNKSTKEMLIEHFKRQQKIGNILDFVPQLQKRGITDDEIDLILQPIELIEDYNENGKLDEIEARIKWLKKLEENNLLIPSLVRYIIEEIDEVVRND
tara:strand:+ start:574 stop:882 length:309 start_codon:yes stop_codon:yes gene_type:complete